MLLWEEAAPVETEWCYWCFLSQEQEVHRTPKRSQGILTVVELERKPLSFFVQHLLVAEPTEPAGEVEMWFTECLPQHHKTKYTRMGVEIRHNSLSTGTQSLKKINFQIAFYFLIFIFYQNQKTRQAKLTVSLYFSHKPV